MTGKYITTLWWFELNNFIGQSSSAFAFSGGLDRPTRLEKKMVASSSQA
jgi:hypothetical protein